MGNSPREAGSVHVVTYPHTLRFVALIGPYWCFCGSHMVPQNGPTKCRRAHYPRGDSTERARPVRTGAIRADRQPAEVEYGNRNQQSSVDPGLSQTSMRRAPNSESLQQFVRRPILKSARGFRGDFCARRHPARHHRCAFVLGRCRRNRIPDPKGAGGSRDAIFIPEGRSAKRKKSGCASALLLPKAPR
jgi:hypothetical protein